VTAVDWDTGRCESDASGRECVGATFLPGPPRPRKHWGTWYVGKWHGWVDPSDPFGSMPATGVIYYDHGPCRGVPPGRAGAL